MRSLRRFSPNVHTLIAAALAVVITLLLVACAGCDAQRLNGQVAMRTAAVPLIVATTTSTMAVPVAHTTPIRASRSQPRTVRTFIPSTGDLSALLDRLATCESGRNPKASGRFHGAFQFMLATWRSLGGAGMPEDQSYEYQKSIAAKIPVSAWHSQFPVCSRRIGV